MKFTAFTPDISRSITSVIHTSPWRIFCEGVIIPCIEIEQKYVDSIFIEGCVDEDLSFCVFDENGVLQGFLAAKKNDDHVLIYLLEAVRNDKYSETLELMLSEICRRSELAGVTDLRVGPQSPVSSTIDMKDDDFQNILFKHGYWQDVLIAAEMLIDLDDYKVPPRIIDREERFANEGILFRPCGQDDFDRLDRYINWKNPERRSWGKLVADVIAVDPTFVFLAVKGDDVIAYSTFFARTIKTKLPEYGPVFTDEKYRGKGIASVILAKSIMQIKELGIAPRIQLSCYPNKFPVYPRQGFYFTQKYLFRVTSKPTKI